MNLLTTLSSRTQSTPVTGHGERLNHTRPPEKRIKIFAPKVSHRHSVVSKNSGSALLEVLISSVLAGFVALLLASVLDRYSQLTLYTKLRKDLDAVTRTITSEINCLKTFEDHIDKSVGLVASCPNDTPLKRANGSILASSTVPVLGRFFIHTECVASGPNVILYANVRVTAPDGSTLASHPLTTEPLDQNNSSLNPLLSSIGSPALCPESFGIYPRILELTLDMQSSDAKIQAAVSASGVSSNDCATTHNLDLTGSYYAATFNQWPRLDNFCFAYCSQLAGDSFRIGVKNFCHADNDNKVNCLCLR